MSSYLPEILRMLSSLENSFRDQVRKLLRSLANGMQQLNRWIAQLPEQVKTAIHTFFGQIGAFAAALQCFFDRGAVKYIPDFSAELKKINGEIDQFVSIIILVRIKSLKVEDKSDRKFEVDTIILDNRRDTYGLLEVLQSAHDSARSMFQRLMVQIRAAQKNNAWTYAGLVGSTTMAGGAIGAAASVPAAVNAAVAATTPTLWGSVCGFLGFSTGAGGTTAAISTAAVAAAPIVAGCAAAGLVVGGIGYAVKKRNDKEIIREAKFQAIMLRDTVCKIKWNAEDLLAKMSNQYGREMCIKLIANLETLKKDIMMGVLLD